MLMIPAITAFSAACDPLLSCIMRSPEAAAECVEPLRTALWSEHSISLMLPPGSPPPAPAPSSLAEEQTAQQGGEALRRNNPQDPEVAADASHELAGSSPFSGKMASFIII